MAEWIGKDNFDPKQFDLNEIEFNDPAERFKEAFKGRR
jgi:hypothetical protein